MHFLFFFALGAYIAFSIYISKSSENSAVCLCCIFFEYALSCCSNCLFIFIYFVQDCSSGEYKSAIAEVLYELSEDPNSFYSLEFFYLTEDTNDKTGSSIREKALQQNTISIKHQVLILAGVVYFIKFLLFWIGSRFA